MMAAVLMLIATAVARIQTVKVSSLLCLCMSEEETINGTGMGP